MTAVPAIEGNSSGRHSQAGQGCTCHSNLGGTSVAHNFPSTYIAGAMYSITISIQTSANPTSGGFNVEVDKGQLMNPGTGADHQQGDSATHTNRTKFSGRLTGWHRSVAPGPPPWTWPSWMPTGTPPTQATDERSKSSSPKVFHPTTPPWCPTSSSHPRRRLTTTNRWRLPTTMPTTTAVLNPVKQKSTGTWLAPTTPPTTERPPSSHPWPKRDDVEGRVCRWP